MLGLAPGFLLLTLPATLQRAHRTSARLPPPAPPNLQLFMRARKWSDMRWQAYAASALMEWRHEAKDT